MLFLPEIVVSVFLVTLLCLMLFKKEPGLALLKPAWLLFGFGSLAAAVYTLNFSGALFESTYTIDLFSQIFKVVLTLVLVVVFFLSEDSPAISDGKRVEYMFFLSTATLGMMMLVSAADILTFYVSLELSSYSLYILSALKRDRQTSEASMKYLVFGAAASGLLLYGFSLLAGVSASTYLPEIALGSAYFITEPAFVVGLALVSMGLLFKLSGFPMHFWAPDVYQSAATPVTTFIATASKAAAVAILIRIFLWMGISDNFVVVLGILAFISMTLGNTVALVQQDVKRLLAYSSIAQAGYIMLGLLSGSFEGFSSAVFYAIAYILMNTGAFLVVLEIARDSQDDNPQISDFNGLADRSPFLALILLLSLLSLAGIPPLIGFTGKWILFSAAMDQGHWFLVLWAVLNSVVSLFYYLILVKHAYMEKPSVSTPLKLSFSVKWIGLLLFIAIVALGIFPNSLIELTQHAIENAIYF